MYLVINIKHIWTNQAGSYVHILHNMYIVNVLPAKRKEGNSNCLYYHPLYIQLLDILFPSNHNIHKSSYGLCFWASGPLIDRFYWSLSIKGSEAQKLRPHLLLWMLWFDKKSISKRTYLSTIVYQARPGGHGLPTGQSYVVFGRSIFKRDYT